MTIDHTPIPPIQFVYSRSQARNVNPEQRNENPHQEGTSRHVPENDVEEELQEDEMVNDAMAKLQRQMNAQLQRRDHLLHVVLRLE